MPHRFINKQAPWQLCCSENLTSKYIMGPLHKVCLHYMSAVSWPQTKTSPLNRITGSLVMAVLIAITAHLWLPTDFRPLCVITLGFTFWTLGVNKLLGYVAIFATNWRKWAPSSVLSKFPSVNPVRGPCYHMIIHVPGPHMHHKLGWRLTAW